MSLIRIIENNIFAVGSYWGRLNSFVCGNSTISSMNTGINVADLNWAWNRKSLEGEDVEIINQIKKNYQELKLPFWWWVYPCGQSIETKKILQNNGFNYLDVIPCLAIDLNTEMIPTKKRDDIEIIFVTSEAEQRIWEDISFTGFEMPRETRKQYNKFTSAFDLSKKSPQRLCLAYFMGQPVATALLFFQKDTMGIYFVTTLFSYRDKGIALALIMGSLMHAKKLKYRYCILQSSKEGLNVYLQAGFKEYCRADVYHLPD